MNTSPEITFSSLALVSHAPRLLCVEIAGREGGAIAELFAALALRGSFYAIAGGEWLPTYTLTRSLHSKTPDVKQTLDRVRLAKPFTCYQVLDLLAGIRPERDPIVILDFPHHFYNPDINLSIRQRVFEQCCRHLQRISPSRPLLTFVQEMQVEEYGLFFPILSSIADDILQAEKTVEAGWTCSPRWCLSQCRHLGFQFIDGIHYD